MATLTTMPAMARRDQFVTVGILEEYLEDYLDRHLAIFFGKMTKHFDEKLQTELGPLKASISNIYATLDATLKRQEMLEHEHLALARQVDRHENWVKELATNNKTQLSSKN